MRRICAFLTVLVFSGFVLASDSTSTTAPATTGKPAVAPAPAAAQPAVAPAPVENSQPATSTEKTTETQTTSPSPAPIVATEAQKNDKKPACPMEGKTACKSHSTCPACPASPAAASPLLTWYGMAQLRLREEICSNKAKNGIDSLSATFQYPLGYKLGVKVRPNDQALLQFEIGNDWYGTDIATGIPGNYYKNRDPMTPWFSLAFAQWDPGYLHIQAGIIPVRGTPLMDLLGVSILNNKKYIGAAHTPWGTVTNLSQTGLRIGAPILKDDIKLGVDLMGAIIEQRAVAAGANTWNTNADALEFLGELPFGYNALTATPQVYAVVDRSFNKATNQGDMEIGAGADFTYKCCEMANFRAGFGYAQNANTYSYAAGARTLKNPLNPSDTSTIAVKPSERSGMNLNVGTTVKLGPGKLDFDFNYSTDKDAKDSTVDDSYPFFDLKYGWAVNKNFVIKPRIRFFITNPKTVYDSKLTSRPELIFEGSF